MERNDQHPNVCGVCKSDKNVDKGRAWDGRRAYRCNTCDVQWSWGMQGLKKSYSDQRDGFQFHDTGAVTQ